MEVIKPEYLKRDSKYIKSLFEIKNGKTFVNEDIQVLFPERFINKKLAVMGSVIEVLGVFGIISNGKYASTIAPIMFRTTPNSIDEIQTDGVNYIVLEYVKGSIFMDSNNLLKNESIMYNIFDEFYLNGKIPWYVDYNGLSKIFLESKKYAGSRIGDDPVALELLTSIATRPLKDKNIFYRNYVKDNKDKVPYTYVGLSDVFYSFKDTGSKLVGSYLKLGVNSALVNKEKEPTKVMSLLRS